MEVAYIISSIRKMNGIERMFVCQMNYLADEYGYDISLLTYEQGAVPVIYPLSDNVHHVDYNIKLFRVYRFSRWARGFILLRWQIKLWKKMRETLSQMNPDVVVCSSYNILEMLLVLSMKDCKRLVQIHSNYYQSGGRLKRHSKEGLLRRLYNRCIAFPIVVTLVRRFDSIVALTEDDKKKWKSDRVTVIPNPLVIIPPTDFVRKENKVVAVGSLHLSKGFDLLIRSWAKIYNKFPDWKLEITGKGEEEANLQRMICGVERASILYPTADIVRRYLSGKIYVFSSRFEGFGLVLLEAMSLGLACVAFDCDFGPREIITDGEDGYLVPPGDVDILAERIDYLICHPEERERLGRNAVEKSKQFNIDKIMTKWRNLYESLS